MVSTGHHALSPGCWQVKATQKAIHRQTPEILFSCQQNSTRRERTQAITRVLSKYGAGADDGVPVGPIYFSTDVKECKLLKQRTLRRECVLKVLPLICRIILAQTRKSASLAGNTRTLSKGENMKQSQYTTFSSTIRIHSTRSAFAM